MMTLQENTRRRQVRRIRWKAGVQNPHTARVIAGIAFGKGGDR
jgi:hypothetical protein